MPAKGQTKRGSNRNQSNNQKPWTPTQFGTQFPKIMELQQQQQQEWNLAHQHQQKALDLGAQILTMQHRTMDYLANQGQQGQQTRGQSPTKTTRTTSQKRQAGGRKGGRAAAATRQGGQQNQVALGASGA